MQLHERRSEIEALGVTVVGVGVREDYQARKLADDGLTFELLLDPENQLRSAVGAADRFKLSNALSPKGIVAYAKAMRRVRYLDPKWTELTQRPGVLLLDANHELQWSRMGQSIGDYPSVDELFDAMHSLPNTP